MKSRPKHIVQIQYKKKPFIFDYDFYYNRLFTSSNHTFRINPENVFQDIQACPEEHIRQESTMRFHIVQKYIILGDTDSK